MAILANIFFSAVGESCFCACVLGGTVLPRFLAAKRRFLLYTADVYDLQIDIDEETLIFCRRKLDDERFACNGGIQLNYVAHFNCVGHHTTAVLATGYARPCIYSL